MNLDGKVDAVDAYLVVQHYAEKITLTEEQLLWADVDGNGRIDMADAYTITLLANN